MSVLATIGSGVYVYIVGMLLSLVFLLALGNGTRQLPDEVFIMALVWPIAVPVVLGQRVYYGVSSLR